jgi:hypothetical protein
MQSIQTREENTLTWQVNKRSWMKGTKGGARMTGHRHVRLIQSREPLREGFNKVRSHTKLLSNIIKVGDIRGETAGRGRAMRDATLDWNAATADAAPVTRGRGCGRTSQVAVGGVDGRSECTLRVGIDEIGEPSDLELSESCIYI